MTLPTHPPTQPSDRPGLGDLDLSIPPDVQPAARSGDHLRSVSGATETFSSPSKIGAGACGAQSEAAHAERWTLRLYVAGQTLRSLHAVANMEKICSEQLQGRYRLEVIDLYQQPQLAQGEQIVAVPTVIRRLPQPLRILIGDMSDRERVLIGLDLLPK